MPFAGVRCGSPCGEPRGAARPRSKATLTIRRASARLTSLPRQPILGLYDPDRSQVLTHLGEIRPFEAFATAIRQVLDAQQGSQGSGIRVLSETVVVADTRGPDRRVPRHGFHGRNGSSGSRSAATTCAKAAASRSANTSIPKYSLEKADVILSLDADFLCTGNGALTHSRAYASRRRLEGDRAQRNRLYSVESSPTNTGTKADHRLLLRASDIGVFARAVAAQLGVAGATGGSAAGVGQAWLGRSSRIFRTRADAAS